MINWNFINIFKIWISNIKKIIKIKNIFFINKIYNFIKFDISIFLNSNKNKSIDKIQKNIRKIEINNLNSKIIDFEIPIKLKIEFISLTIVNFLNILFGNLSFISFNKLKKNNYIFYKWSAEIYLIRQN